MGQQPAKVIRHGWQRRPRSHRLDVGVVVRRGVDVVGHEPAIGGLDELKAGDADALARGKLQVAVDYRTAEAVPKPEQARLRGALTVDRAGISRAQPETTARRIGGDGIDELVTYDLHSGYLRLGSDQVLLQQGDAVDRRLVPRSSQVVVEVLMSREHLHAQALAALIVLADEGNGDPPCRGRQPARASNGNRPRHVESRRPQGGELLDFAHLQVEDPAPVDDAAAVRLKPCQDAARLVLGERVSAGMRGRAHPGPEDAVRRRLADVDGRLTEQPLLVRQAGAVERRRKRRVPLGVLVDHVQLQRCLLPQRASFIPSCEATKPSRW